MAIGACRVRNRPGQFTLRMIISSSPSPSENKKQTQNKTKREQEAVVGGGWMDGSLGGCSRPRAVVGQHPSASEFDPGVAHTRPPRAYPLTSVHPIDSDVYNWLK